MKTAGAMLTQALEARGFRVLAAQERPWASVTFTGAQHRLRIAVAVDEELTGIEEAEWALDGHLVADLVVVAREAGTAGVVATIEALTIEDWRPDGEAAGAVARSSRRRLGSTAVAACGGGSGGESQRLQPPPGRRREGLTPTSRGTKRAPVPLAAA